MSLGVLHTMIVRTFKINKSISRLHHGLAMGAGSHLTRVGFKYKKFTEKATCSDLNCCKQVDRHERTGMAIWVRGAVHGNGRCIRNRCDAHTGRRINGRAASARCGGVREILTTVRD